MTQEPDPEIVAMTAAIAYFEASEPRARERFIHHLAHRYFPHGRFNADSRPIGLTARTSTVEEIMKMGPVTHQ